MNNAALQALKEGLLQLQRPAEPWHLQALQTYVEELLRWNRQTNLTAITAPEEVVPKHILDSLAALPRQPLGAVCDIGSGAGLPGLIWALFDPQLEVTSVDARTRKVAFQNHVARLLGLRNFRAIHARIEDVPQQFPYLTCRAFAGLTRMLELVEARLAPGGRMLALKGPGVEEELSALDESMWRYTICPLQVPGLSAQRSVVVLQRAAESPAKPLQMEPAA